MNSSFKRRDIKTTVRHENGTIIACLKQLCLCDDMADVTFTFQDGTPSRIPAHKMILAMRSDVFKAMFYGGHDQLGSTDSVEVTDITPWIFQHFLRFVYTDQVDLTGSNVMPLLYASDKYNVKSLIDRCESYLESGLDVGSVCTIFAFAKQLSRKGLQAKTLSFITDNAKSVFVEEDFLSLSSDNLEDVLAIGTLRIKEIEIFKAVMKWVETKLEKEKLSVTGIMKRKLLLPNILYLIAIPSLSLEDFTTTVVPSDVLTNEEQLMLFKAITMNVTETSNKFRIHPRKGRDPVKITFSDFFHEQKQNHWMRRTTNHTETACNVENITIKPYERIRVVSANINICSHSSFQFESDKKITITCTALGKCYAATCDRNGRCSVVLAVDIPTNETRNLVFEITGEESSTLLGKYDDVLQSTNTKQMHKMQRNKAAKLAGGHQNVVAHSTTYLDPKCDIRIDGCNIVENIQIDVID